MPETAERKSLVDLSPKKNLGQLVSVLGAVVLIVVGISLWANLRGGKSSITGINIIGPSPAKYSQIYEVKPAQVLLVPLEVTYAPARFHGDWISKRIGTAGLTHDLVSFQITSTGDEVLYRKAGDSFGKFDLVFRKTGTYTIKLDNTGLLRNTPRSVVIEATLEPPN